ncbi:hypothetical protein ACJJTC_010535 [Scirpophaga incertulas]
MFQLLEEDTLRALIEEDDCETDYMNTEEESEVEADHISADSNTDSEVDADIPSSNSDSDDLSLLRCNKLVSYTTPLVLHFKYNFDDEYTLMNITANQRVLARSKRNVRQASISSPAEQPLKLAYTQPLPVSKALHNDLISLCKSGVIPPFYHGFYDSLTSVEDPECNENEEDQEDLIL